MKTVEKSIEVDLPIDVVYDQWTQFEQFPQFMEGVKEVTQLDDKHLRWRAEIGGRNKEWVAEILEQLPDERIAWRRTRGAENSEMVNVTLLGPNKTRVTLRLNYETKDPIEAMGSALEVLAARVLGDLKRFKEFVEIRRTPTGAWRRKILGRKVYATQ